MAPDACPLDPAWLIGHLLSLEWSMLVHPDSRLPAFHLDLKVDNGRPSERVLTGHILEGRLVRTCLPGSEECTAAAGAALVVDSSSLLILFDRTADYPVARLLSPPTKLEATFESLLFLGGIVDRWLEPMRHGVVPERAVPAVSHHPWMAEAAPDER